MEKMESMDSGIEEALMAAQEKGEQRLAELEKASKSLSELIARERFYVDSVIRSCQPICSRSYSEIRFNQEPVYSLTGYLPTLDISVLPDRHEIPVRRLLFSGYSAVRGGDYIVALIPKYREEKLEGFGASAILPPALRRQQKTFYLERDFMDTESAIELMVFNSGGRVVSTDRSADYGEYYAVQKKQSPLPIIRIR